MAIRPILMHPDPRLRRISEAVRGVDGAIRALMDDMLETMYDAPGVGLSAPQIGVFRRVIVLDCAGEGETPAPLRMVNPEVLSASERLVKREEGCLSIPGEFAEITRPERVTLRYLDESGNVQQREFTDLWAVCAQHEVDHLNGRLFIDYLGRARRMMITNRARKRLAEVQGAKRSVRAP